MSEEEQGSRRRAVGLGLLHFKWLFTLHFSRFVSPDDDSHLRMWTNLSATSWFHYATCSRSPFFLSLVLLYVVFAIASSWASK